MFCRCAASGSCRATIETLNLEFVAEIYVSQSYDCAYLTATCVQYLKRQINPMAPPFKRRKVLPNAHVEQLTFDPTARNDYLTGFHKRKQARIKHAREAAAKKEREERVRERRQVWPW